MISFKDQLGRVIHLKDYPRRIVSVVPSQTELLFDLGLRNEVVGITKFCVHPQEWFRNKPRVGGTKTLNMEIIHSLEPDLVIANKEENTKTQIDEIALKYPVWISDVNDLDSAIEMIVSLGELTNKIQQANSIANGINNKFRLLSCQPYSGPGRRGVRTAEPIPNSQTAYLIWKDPYMTVGEGTFISAMLEICGFKNAFQHFNRYPQVTISDLKAANCQFLFLSSEPFPFRQKHIKELKVHLPDTKIILVDGEMFSWYGSRLLQATDYFQKLISEVYSL